MPRAMSAPFIARGRLKSMGVGETWTSAAHAFAELVEQLPVDRWEAPGLGVWSLRDLVGHTSSAGLGAVIETLDRPASSEDITSPEGYYALAKSVDRATYQAAVASSIQDAQQQGERLGDHPGIAVQLLVDQAIAKLDTAEGDILIDSAAGGMRLHTWLPTRTFELAVHSLDIARAAGLPALLPDRVIADATVLAARIAIATGDGPSLLLAMTGRAALPREFSVV